MASKVFSDIFSGTPPFRLDRLDIPANLRLLVLAPHPDDFDSMGITMRYFWGRRHPIHLLVLSSSANGVEDSFCSPPTDEVKAALREAEQLASCRFFGLPEDRLEFLRLETGLGGYIVDNEENFYIVYSHIQRFRPDILFLTHGNDTNSDHCLAYRWWSRAAASSGRPMAALLVRDPKTIAMRDDVYMPFDEEAARWKAELLRFHRSQHQRNLNTRGHGFDERILRVNRESAARLGIPDKYAEVFELEFS